MIRRPGDEGYKSINEHYESCLNEIRTSKDHKILESLWQAIVQTLAMMTMSMSQGSYAVPQREATYDVFECGFLLANIIARKAEIAC